MKTRKLSKAISLCLIVFLLFPLITACGKKSVKPITEKTFRTIMEKHDFTEYDDTGTFLAYHDSIKFDDVKTGTVYRRKFENDKYCQTFIWFEFFDEESAKGYYKDEYEAIYNELDSRGGEYEKVRQQENYESFWAVVQYRDYARFYVARIDNTVIISNSDFYEGAEFDNVLDILDELGFYWPDMEGK